MAKTPHLVWPIRLVLPHVAGPAPALDDPARPPALRSSRAAAASCRLRSAAIFASHPAGAALKPEFRHGFAYSDCRGDDARLVIANLLGAQRHGATHPGAPSLRRRRARRRCLGYRAGERDHRRALHLARPRDRQRRRPLGDRGRGAAIERRRRPPAPAAGQGQPHRRAAGNGRATTATSCRPRDGRTMEAFPFEEDFTSIGTTDEPWDEPPEARAHRRPRDRLHAGRGEPLSSAGPCSAPTSSGATPACARCSRSAAPATAISPRSPATTRSTSTIATAARPCSRSSAASSPPTAAWPKTPSPRLAPLSQPPRPEPHGDGDAARRRPRRGRPGGLRDGVEARLPGLPGRADAGAMPGSTAPAPAPSSASAGALADLGRPLRRRSLSAGGRLPDRRRSGPAPPTTSSGAAPSSACG